jgi:hypothetical protein
MLHRQGKNLESTNKRASDTANKQSRICRSYQQRTSQQHFGGIRDMQHGLPELWCKPSTTECNLQYTVTICIHPINTGYLRIILSNSEQSSPETEIRGWLSRELLNLVRGDMEGSVSLEYVTWQNVDIGQHLCREFAYKIQQPISSTLKVVCYPRNLGGRPGWGVLTHLSCRVTAHCGMVHYGALNVCNRRLGTAHTCYARS